MAIEDNYGGQGIQTSTQGRSAVSVTPNDSADLDKVAKALYVGTSGNIKVTNYDDTEVTFTNVPVGIFPHLVKRVHATGTTASGIIAITD